MPFPSKKEENKKIIEMKDKKNMSFSEIGDELGITKQAVHERYQKYKQ